MKLSKGPHAISICFALQRQASIEVDAKWCEWEYIMSQPCVSVCWWKLFVPQWKRPRLWSWKLRGWNPGKVSYWVGAEWKLLSDRLIPATRGPVRRQGCREIINKLCHVQRLVRPVIQCETNASDHCGYLPPGEHRHNKTRWIRGHLASNYMRCPESLVLNSSTTVQWQWNVVVVVKIPVWSWLCLCMATPITYYLFVASWNYVSANTINYIYMKLKLIKLYF